jgi:hypothetical protein
MRNDTCQMDEGENGVCTIWAGTVIAKGRSVKNIARVKSGPFIANTNKYALPFYSEISYPMM